ncbi:MAG: MTAP family purine nucleoside phosphorylase [Actinobacteria bacterium]|nr:MTAP family purine nucleoside phosphorylase [Actinomycetota bacterium]
MSDKIPAAQYAIIGGSSTFSIKFPDALGESDVEIVEGGMVFDTPYGESPRFKLFKLGGRPVLTCKMHGWRSGVSRADASRQVFWVFREAGVKRILTEGGVGAVNHLLNPRDIVIPTDYIDNSMRKDANLGSDYLLIMRKAICPDLHESLLQAARKIAPARVFERGIYANTDGHHFESPAEVSVLRQWGADIVGQSICPEVYLAREIGACYAGAYLVVNYAEGIVEDWKHDELSSIFYGESEMVGRLLISALRGAGDNPTCECAGLRKPTLLKEEL